MVCIWQESYFESPEFYALALHLLSIIQVPLGVFGAFVVYYKTPKNMEKVRFIIMMQHLACFWLDVYLNILSIPYIIFSALSGFPLGILGYLGVPTWILIYIGIGSMYFVGCTLMAFFEDRYNRLVRRDADTVSRQRKRILYYIVNYTIVILLPMLIFFDFPSVQESREILSHDFPCLPLSLMERPGFFMLSSDSSLLVITMAGYLLFTGFQAYYYMIRTSRYLHNIKSQSQRTTQLQKQLFKALCIQAFIPVLAFIAPCLYIQISTALHYVDMILGNISMIWLTTHGIISTTTMLVVHKPYREAVLGMVKCKKSVTNAPSQNNSLVKL